MQRVIDMFTGIIETTGVLLDVQKDRANRVFRLSCPFVQELRVDQSLAHNGVCLTVTAVEENAYSVTAIHETLEKTTLGQLKPGDPVNLERCLRWSDRLDGHIVQGHVDTPGEIVSIKDMNGSRLVSVEYAAAKGITVEKGSVCVNGVSLTVVNSAEGRFDVVIIPYTWEHTNFHCLQTGDRVNIEFDILGKYVERLMGAGKRSHL